MRNIFYLILLLSIFGCGGQPLPDGMPKLFECNVKILSEGQPLPDVTVEFCSSDPDFKWGTSATTDENGNARMVTYGKYFGVPEGEYTVIVHKLQREEFDPERPPRQVRLFTLTDPQYTSPKTTPLKITVNGKTAQEFDVGKTDATQVLRMEDAM